MSSSSSALEQLSLLAADPLPAGFQVRESARARHLSIQVCPSRGVEVIVPRHTSARQVQRFVRENASWIDAARREVARRCPPRDRSPPTRIELAALERQWVVSYRTAQPRNGVTRSGSGQLVVRTRLDSPDESRAVLLRWLAAQARDSLGKQLRELAAEHGFIFQRMQIRGQRTRWGSCSNRGTISLNYCLLFLEPAAVRYLLIHELCHTRVMSHSARFWAQVQSIEPAYRRLDKSLDRAWRLVPGWASPL